VLGVAIMVVIPQSCRSVFTSSAHRQAEVFIAGNSRNYKESPKVVKAKKFAEKKEEKRDKEWAKYVKETKKLHYNRQSDEVKARIKRNEQETEFRHKERARQIKKDSRNRAKKFR
jgi:hypothetical protein